MGGYGAVHLALRHPDQFAAVASLSGALYAPDVPLTEADIADFHGAFGEPFDPTLRARSVYTDLSELPSDATPPRVYLARAVFYSVWSVVAAEAERALGILGRDGGERRAELDVERI